MARKSGRQKGPQRHAEGAHGEKTHAKLQEELQSRGTGDLPRHETGTPHFGGHRIDEQVTLPRQQHDEAEKNSEKKRTLRELDADPDHVPGLRSEDVKGRGGGEPGH